MPAARRPRQRRVHTFLPHGAEQPVGAVGGDAELVGQQWDLGGQRRIGRYRGHDAGDGGELAPDLCAEPVQINRLRHHHPAVGHVHQRSARRETAVCRVA